MKDRVPTPGQEGRVKITPESGGAAYYAKIEMADNPTQLGDEPVKANLLPDAVATALGLTGNPQVKDALMRVAPWRLLQAYTVAGSYTFTVPEGITELGAFVIGGGGAGGLATYVSNSKLAATGGGSGRTNKTVITSPFNSTYPVVVGAGGNGVTGASEGRAGNNGNSSSFNGVTALGGTGGNGTVSDVRIRGVTGGQGSSAIVDTYASIYIASAPSKGRINAASDDYGCVQGTTYVSDCFNPFDNKFYLIAGGGACLNTNGTSFYETAGSDDLGLVGASGSVTATPAVGTSYGCGGGGMAIIAASATSGSGRDGAVLIYGR